VVVAHAHGIFSTTTFDYFVSSATTLRDQSPSNKHAASLDSCSSPWTCCKTSEFSMDLPPFFRFGISFCDFQDNVGLKPLKRKTAGSGLAAMLSQPLSSFRVNEDRAHVK
jgi:hypothetical protein